MELRKLLSIVAMMSLFVVAISGNPLVWDEAGIPIRQGSSIEWSRAAAPIGEDKVVYVWSDTRGGDRDLWTQAIDADGVVWNNGESVLVDGKTDRQEDPVVISTSDGHAIIAWIDFHYQTIDGNVMAQKISNQGELMWEQTAYVSMAEDVQISLNIVPNNEGGAHIIWHDQRSGSGVEIYGMHLNADGEPYSEGWTEDGLPLATGRGNQHFHTFWQDGNNGAILAYVNEVDGGQDLHVKRISADGDFLWERELAAGAVDYASARVQPFGDDAFGFAYTDRRDGRFKIYLQAINLENGEDVWEESIPVDPEAHGETYDQTNPRVIESTDGNFIVVWQDYRLDIGVADIYVQKFDIEGNRLWEERGVPVVVQEYSQINPRMESDGEGGCLIVWEDAREGGHPNINIYMQRVSSDGEVMWEENGKAVAQIAGEAFSPLAKYSGDHLFVAWGDMRNGSIGIYSQAYDRDGNQIFEDNGIRVYWGLSGDAIDHTTVRNGDYVYNVWQDTRYANFGSQIKVQKVNLQGEIQFERNGISVTEHTGANQVSGTHQDAISVVPHHSGGIALAWVEQRADNELVYAQAIGPDGERLWQNDGMDMGIRVTSLDNVYTQDNPTISRGGDSYVIVWDQTDPGDEFTYERDLVAQKLSDGNRVWGDEGIVIAWQEGPQINHFVSDVINGEYIVWRRGDGTNAVIYAKRIDEDGNAYAGWDEYGLVVCDYPFYVQRGIRSLMTDEGLVILWEDQRAREGQPVDASIFGQLINEDGEIQWRDNGTVIADFPNDQVMISAQYDEGYVYLAWRDARLDPNAQDISYQKLDLAGAPQWDVPSPFVIRSSIEHDTPSLVKVGDAVLVVWENNYGELGSDLHMQLADAYQGASRWPEDGEILISTIKRQVRPKAIPFDDKHSYILWADGRSSGKEEIVGLYAQKIDMSIDLSVDDVTINPFDKMQLHANYPNPFNPETKISFALGKNEEVSLNVYNVRGQLVKTLIDNEYIDRGNHSVVWNGTDNKENSVGSGVYFYKLQSETDNQTKKMLLLK